MGKITQKVINLIESGQLLEQLKPPAHYVLSFLKLNDSKKSLKEDEICYKEHPFLTANFINIYQVRRRNLSMMNIEHGGFLETINSLKKLAENPAINVLTITTNGYHFVCLLETETENIVGILYVKQTA